MRKARACLLAFIFAAPLSAFAQNVYWQPSGNAGIWYSYADQKIESTDHSPSGGGIGFDGKFNLPFHLFIDGMFQFNDESYPYEEQTDGRFYGASLSEQSRIGGGLQFVPPGLPLNLFGKIEYVNYRFRSPLLQDQFGDVYREHDNDDGGGYFLGFRTLNPGPQIYGQGGYLDLSDSHGQEYKLGLAWPIGRIMRRRATVELFAEYDWTRLHANHGDDDTFENFLPGLMYDYHVGVRIPFY